MTGFVYFARQVGGQGPVKIGFSENPIVRLRTLMTWSPYPLEIVATIEGDTALEARFHARFRDDHSHHEWFRPSADLDAVMAQVAAGVFDIAVLPKGQRPHIIKREPWTPHQKMSASLGRRIQNLMGKKVAIPSDVHAAVRRYCGWRDCDPALSGRASDADLIQSFLALHGYRPKPVPVIDLSAEGAAA